MKKILLFLSLVSCGLAKGQVPAYYNNIDINLTGQNLFDELSNKVTTTHSTFLSYTPGVWDALKQSDVDPTNASKVILIYGYNDSDNNSNTDRTRNINNNGGSTGQWNREHVYPKSLGNPNLGTTGPGADAHHLRPADISRNSNRGSRKFADDSGNSGTTSQGHWYPGDEFKGDVARMMMYMYIRYGNRCLPSNVGIGTPVSSDTNMLELFLEWNAQDPVSSLELQRNPILENLQGNRNPFIDNPAFATAIWGGPQAEDRFGNASGGGNTNTLCTSTVTAFPYSESFENTLGAWNQSSTDDFNWTTRTGTTPSSNTGPSSANNGSYYLYMESSSPNYSNKTAIIYGPCFNLSVATQATFSFKYHMYGSNSMGNLNVEASLNGINWTSIWSASGNQGNAWQSANVNLNSYLGDTVQLRFNGTTGTTWQGDMAIDDLNLTTSASGGGAPNATNINLSITFDNYPEETTWEIRNSSNVILFSGGTYGSQADGATINIPNILADGCYSLHFYDTYGDGICCSYGNGSFTLTHADTGATLATGGDFSSSTTENFCIGASSKFSSESKTSKTNAIYFYPNPVVNTITLYADKNSNYQILDHTGKLIKDGVITAPTINLESLASGLYTLSFIKDNSAILERFVKE